MFREQFFDAREQLNVRGMTDIQIAARFYIAIQESFGADCRSFGVRSKDINKKVSGLVEVSERLKKVVIENQDFEKIIKTYDRSCTLFYLEPPYYDAERYYPDRLNPDDHVRLKDELDVSMGNAMFRTMIALKYGNCIRVIIL